MGPFTHMCVYLYCIYIYMYMYIHITMIFIDELLSVDNLLQNHPVLWIPAALLVQPRWLFGKWRESLAHYQLMWRLANSHRAEAHVHRLKEFITIPLIDGKWSNNIGNKVPKFPLLEASQAMMQYCCLNIIASLTRFYIQAWSSLKKEELGLNVNVLTYKRYKTKLTTLQYFPRHCQFSPSASF